MRKVLLFILLFIIIIFIIPIFLVNRRILTVGADDSAHTKIEELSIDEYDYSKYTKIKLLHKKTGEIEEINLDEYIANVVSAEMPVKFDIEALKAQAIVARTYTIYKITKSKKHKEADICDDSTCCQAWISKEDRLKKWNKDKANKNWNKIIKAVNDTKGKIITYKDKPINAFFHANSGGKTDVPLYVWGGEGYPYLQVVETSGEENYSEYRSEAEFTKKEFEEKIKAKHKDFKIDYKQENCISIKERDDSNRVKTVKIGNLNLSGVEARTILGLRSANFEVQILEDKIKFTVIGYGHGVGMSQTGADSLAKQGKNYEEIIKHFYKDVEIREM